MFDEVTRRETARRAGRRGLFLLGSSALQAAAAAALVFASAAIHAREAEAPLVPVKIVKAATPSLPQAPKPPPRPRNPTKPAAPPPSAALVQPKEIPQDLQAPDASPEEEVAEGGAEDGGVIGGVVGPPGPPGPVAEPAPAYAGEGFTKPRQAEASCVQNAIRIPRGLAGLAASVTVKFAIGVDGAPSLFQPATPGADARLTAAIWQAIRQCRWIAGTNAEGKPTKIWVIMPFRFQSG